MSNFIKTLTTRPSEVVSQDPTSALHLVKSHVDEVIKLYKENDPSKKTDFEEITIQGLDANQVWWQAKMVLDDVEGNLMDRIQKLKNVIEEANTDSVSYPEENSVNDASLESETDDEVDNSSSDDDLPTSVNEDEANAEHRPDYSSVRPPELQLIEDKNEVDSFQKMAPAENEESVEESEGRNKTKTNKHGLNDDFFDLDEFNRQTLTSEGAKSGDDASVDYFEELPSDEDEEAIYYDDFFDKPNSPSLINRRSASKDSITEGFTDADFEDAVSSAKLDLFAEDLEDVHENASDEDTKEKLSSFEKQQIAVQKQIEQLEKEAISEKKWALKGEVKAKDRPDDALLTEDIEFDRTSKPVPVITAEVTESLEDMIRRRIKDDNFDDLQRRLISHLPSKLKKSQFELSDQKSSKSLAEIYEDDYNGISQETVITDELKKSHDEILEMFTNLSFKLDALSSAHFIPKPPQKSLEVRVQTDAISMEDAQPLTMSASSALAPQEVYKIGKSDDANVIKLKDGTVMSKEELTREDKNRLRRAIKRKRSKAAAQTQQGNSSKKSKKNDAIETLSMAKNVTVINKRGEKSDVRGKERRFSNSGKTGHRIKL